MSSTGEKAYELAKQAYAEINVDTDQALAKLATIAVSIHCWQGDDVGGFENPDATLDGGIMATGNYPGKARTPEELRADVTKTLSLLPGKHRFNLHAIYGEFGGKKVDRNEIQPDHFKGWIDWAREQGIALDFNGTYFSHPKAASGFTLSSADESIRSFWVEHGIACRNIAVAMGTALGTPAVHNTWIPDGYKDIPADRTSPRERLATSLDEILAAKLSENECIDAVESKLFGIGSESYVVGSHEFYLGYAARKGVMLCLDNGHFHPTEQVADKLSATLINVPRVLLHLTRGVRWDSDHVTLFTDEIRDIALELVRGDHLSRVSIATDFFDASINRIAAWTIGLRSVLKALLYALLEPTEQLRRYENEGDLTSRLALMEAMKSMPFGAVWNHYCEKNDVPVGLSWLDEVRKYEKDVLVKR